MTSKRYFNANIDWSTNLILKIECNAKYKRYFLGTRFTTRRYLIISKDIAIVLV
jgi:hypothetical protein